MSLRTIEELHGGRAFGRDARLTPEMYKDVLAELTPILREQSKRDLWPVTEVNDPGVIKSKRMKILDLGEAEFGPNPIAKTWDKPDLGSDEETVYRIKKNIYIPDIEIATSRRGGYDVLQQATQLMLERIILIENEALAKSKGAFKGISGITYDNSAGNGQTFSAGAAWTTAGQAIKDIAKAVDNYLGNKSVPEDSVAMALNGVDMANLRNVFSGTAVKQLQDLEELLPGGIRKSKDITSGSAYVYARTKSVLELIVYEPVHLIPLPKLDEEERARMRTSWAGHWKQKEAAVKISGI